jgi:hypothetical protein
MARRSRSQSVLARHRTSATLVGAVGRACVGFGLAVGRSRSIRPIVNLSDVNSATLRPPTNFWRESVTDDPVAVTGAASVAGASAGGQRVVRRSVDRRPTWTDQVIQRSGIGYTAPPAGALAEPVAVPDDFQPFGDPRIDHLRLLRRAAASAPVTDTPPMQVRRSSRSTDVRDSDTEAADGGRVRGDTVAGRGTGPGRLARAVTPEPVAARSAAAVGRPGPGSTVGSELPVNRSPGDGPVRRSPQPRQVQAPSRLDTLRALLVEQGKLSADPNTAAPTGAAGAADRTTPSGSSATPRPTPPGTPSAGSSDVVRRRPAETLGDGRAPQPPREVAPDDAGRRVVSTSAGLRDAAGARFPGDRTAAAAGTATTTSRSDRNGPSTRSDGTPPTGPRPGSAQGPDGGDVRPVGSAVPVEELRSPGALPSPTNASTPTTASTTTIAAPVDGEATSIRRQLRTQRLLSSGLAPDRSDSPDPAREIPTTAPRDHDVTPSARMTVRPPAGTPPTEAGAVSTIERTVRTSPSATLPWSNERPELPSSIARAPGSVIRRVTLPRALSSSFRPETVLSAHRVVSQPAPPSPTGVAPATTVRPPIAQPDRDVSNEQPAGVADLQRSGVAPSMRTSALQRPARDSITPRTTIQRETAATTGTGTMSPTVTGHGVPTSNATRLPSVDRRVGVPATSPVTTGVPATPWRATDTRRSSVLPAGAGALQQVLRRTPENQSAPLSVSASPDDITSSASRISSAGADSGAAVREDLRPAGAPLGARASTVAPAGAIVPAVLRTPAVPHASTEPERSSEPAHASTKPARSSTAAATDTRPAERLAERFMTELSQTVRHTSAPLPMPFRPMSDAITGGRRVMLSTDPASRRAFRSVGKMAATTGDTIHLDHAAIPRRRLDEVLAHELTHVAHPSPAPRFFDDVDDSPEERRAEKVASIMARSPLAPSSTVAAPRASSDTIRRSVDHAGGGAREGASSSSSSGTISADALAARLAGSVSQ